MPPMIEKRSCPYVVHVQKKIIVIGGNVGFLTCEMFNLETNQWNKISDLKLEGLLKIRVYENEVFVLMNRDLYKYDLKLDTWVFEHTIPLELCHFVDDFVILGFLN